MTFRVRHLRCPTGDVAEFLDGCPTFVSQYSLHNRVSGVTDDQSRARDNAHEVTKLSFDLFKIGEDVCMIKLYVVQDCGPWPVMHKLRALVEERCVVLVRFDDKQVRQRQTRRDREVAWDAPDQETWSPARMLENPRKHRRSGRFSVRS